MREIPTNKGNRKMNTITTATWRALNLYNGQPDKFINHHKRQGYRAIFPKIGNGATPWQGLSGHFDAAADAGLNRWAWWYLKAESNEGVEIGKHAKNLGVQLLALDVESHWERNAGVLASTRKKTARDTLDQIRAAGYQGDLALCSWWHLDYHHKVPFGVFLERCDWNMPQMYWIGRFGEAGAVDLVRESWSMYANGYGFPRAFTIPVFPAFGETYGKDNNWWKVTIPQMKAAVGEAEALGLGGVTWYSTDYLLGKTGHEQPKTREDDMLDYIKSTTENETDPNGVVYITIDGPKGSYKLTEVSNG